jgi:hypothetical protein
MPGINEDVSRELEQFLYLPQGLLDQGIERFGMEQCPSLAGQVETLYEALCFAALYICRGGFFGQRLWRVAGDLRGGGPREIRPDRACSQHDANS